MDTFDHTTGAAPDPAVDPEVEAAEAAEETDEAPEDEAEVTDVEREIQTFGDALEQNDLGFSTR